MSTQKHDTQPKISVTTNRDNIIHTKAKTLTKVIKEESNFCLQEELSTRVLSLSVQDQCSHFRGRFVVPDSFLGVTLILSAFAAAHMLKPGEETNSLTAFVVLSSVSFFHSSFVSLLLSGVLWKEEGKVSDSDGGNRLIPLIPE